MTEFRIVVFGTPAPQGSKTFYGSSAGGKGRFVESSKKVKPWRSAVQAAAEKIAVCQCFEQCGALAPGFPLTAPLVARMVFSFARPKSHYRTGRNAHLLRDNAPLRPAGAPDTSKLQRSTEDALNALLWKDDALVVEYERAAKVYVGEDPEALDAPGALIVIRPLVDVLDPNALPLTLGATP